MSTETMMWAAVLIEVMLILVLGYFWLRQRRDPHGERFGPKYERTVGKGGSRTAVGYELPLRRMRFDHFGVQPLDPDSRQSYAKTWTRAQARFVEGRVTRSAKPISC